MAPIVMVLALSGRSDAVDLPLPKLDYDIEVWLDPARRGLHGTVKIRWHNPSEQAIKRVPLHLYLNAFNHADTTWTRTAAFFRFALERMLARYDDPWGSTDVRRLRQVLADGTLRDLPWRAIQPDDGNVNDRSLVEVTLAEAIEPGQRLKLEVSFTARLPIPIARTGGADGYFMAAQWYPKLGAFEARGVRHRQQAGWAARQFHGPTEFYANFANYAVTIHVPKGYVVGATGEQVHARVNGDEQVLRFKQQAVHDFAFVASSQLVAHKRSHRRPSGEPLNIRYLVPPGTEHQIGRWQRAVSGAIDMFDKRVGPYPYKNLTLVFPPWRWIRTGGMEYPTLITNAPGDPLWDGFPFGTIWKADSIAIHEFGHQYFYGLLASNEQEDAFLDESFTMYWELEGMRAVYGGEASAGTFLGRPIDATELVSWDLAQDAELVFEPLRKQPSALFYPGSWRAQIYYRAAMALATAARLFGQHVIDKIFSAYYKRFVFRHPDTEDFLAVARQVGGEAVALFLREAFTRPQMPDYRIKIAETRLYQAPLGKLASRGERDRWITRDNRHRHVNAGLGSGAWEKGGRITVEVTDPGWVHADGSDVRGTVRRLERQPTKASDASKRAKEFYTSVVLIEGPGWSRLPVEIAFVFEDGLKLRERWDGKSRWRRYRFTRRAKLRRATVDPERRIQLDVWPQNNARAAQAHDGFASSWSWWLTATAQWLSMVAATWL